MPKLCWRHSCGVPFLHKPFRSAFNLGKQVRCFKAECCTCPSCVGNILRLSFLHKPFRLAFNLSKQVRCFETKCCTCPSCVCDMPVESLLRQATSIDVQSRQTGLVLQNQVLHMPKPCWQQPEDFLLDKPCRSGSISANRFGDSKPSFAHAQATLATAVDFLLHKVCSYFGFEIHSSILFVLGFLNFIFPIAWTIFAACRAWIHGSPRSYHFCQSL